MFNSSSLSLPSAYVCWQVCALDLTSTCKHNYFSLFYWFWKNSEIFAFCSFRQNRLIQFVPRDCPKNKRLLFNYIRPNVRKRIEDFSPPKFSRAPTNLNNLSLYYSTLSPFASISGTTLVVSPYKVCAFIAPGILNQFPIFLHISLFYILPIFQMTLLT